jgi:hypothetical protein
MSYELIKNEPWLNHELIMIELKVDKKWNNNE